MLSQNYDRGLISERFLNSLKRVAGKLKDKRIGIAVLLLEIKKSCFEESNMI